MQALQEVFDLCADITFREIKLSLPVPVRAFIVFADSLCDSDVINESILKSIMQESSAWLSETENCSVNLPEFILERLLTNFKAHFVSKISNLVNDVLENHLILVIDGYSVAIAASVQGYNQREVDEPTTEPTVRGPRDGFVENLSTNLSLLRRRIRSSQFKVETTTVGKLSRTKVAVCYIKEIANYKTVGEVKQRLAKIQTDSILESGYIEDFIVDDPFTVFPLIQYTQRPDRVAASLFEGRIAIIVDNTPSTLIVPCTVTSLLQAAEDYYINPLLASLIRGLRFLAMNIALLLPAVTIAVFTYHQELIPISFLVTVAGARENLPLPFSVEIFLVELTFEFLQEAGIRLPRTVGQTVSTVGGLVIGQMAVSAGFVSPISVVVVASTAVAAFLFPDYAFASSIRALRFLLIILASILGTIGIIIGLMIILAHLSSLRSFGVPYLSPVAPLSPRDLKDTFVRAPWWMMFTRPHLLSKKNPVRQNFHQEPEKPGEEGNNQ